MPTMIKADIDTRRHELRAELADSMAAIVREANPRTLRALARDLEEDARHHRGVVAIRSAKTRDELDAACRLAGIDPARREVVIPNWNPPAALLDRLHLPPPASPPERWSRTFHKVRALADAAGMSRASVYTYAKTGRIKLRRVLGGWQIRLDDLPADMAAKLE